MESLLRENSNKLSNLLSTVGGGTTENMWKMLENDTRERNTAIAFCEIGRNFSTDLETANLGNTSPIVEKPNKITYIQIREIILAILQEYDIVKVKKTALIELSKVEEAIYGAIKLTINYHIKPESKTFQSKKITLVDISLTALHKLIKEIKGLPITKYDYTLYTENGNILSDEDLKEISMKQNTSASALSGASAGKSTRLDKSTRLEVPIIKLKLTEKSISKT